MVRLWVPFVYITGCIFGIYGCNIQEELLRRINDIEAREKLYLKRIDNLEKQVERQSLMIQQLKETASKETFGNKSDEVAVREDKSDTNPFNKDQEIVEKIKPTLQINRLKRVADMVAFNAVVRVGSINHVGELQTIHFDAVLLNEGNAFLTHSSIFVAPVRGLYMFSASVCTGGGQEVQASIMKNSESVSRVYSYEPERTDQGSVTSTIILEAGDEVYVRCDYPPDTYVHGNGFTSFTGFLIVAL